MTIKFKLRRPNEEQTSLFIEFKKGGSKIVLFPGKVVQTEFWHQDNQICKPNHPASAEMNLFLKKWKEEVERIILNLETNKEFVTKQRIQEELDKRFKPEVRKEKTGVNDFVTFIDWYINEKKDELAYTTIQIYKQVRKFLICAFELTTKKQISEFNELSPRKKSEFELQPNRRLPFERIDDNFLREFKAFLNGATYKTKERGVEIWKPYLSNYISKQLKDLKTLIIAAKAEKLVQEFSTTVKYKFVEVDNVYLNWTEIAKLRSLDLREYPQEEFVRDRFVFNCYLGLRVSDLKKLDKTCITKTTLNNEIAYIYSDRAKKTGRRVQFYMEPEAVEILKKYEFNFPSISDKEYNEQIKMVALKAGLTQLIRRTEVRANNKEVYTEEPKYLLISSHTARRSFCTNYYEEGLDVPTIMSVSAHKNQREFFKYISKDVAVRIDITAQRMKEIRDKRVILSVA